MVDDATLAGVLERIGWEAEPHGERTLRSIHKTSEGDVKVYLRTDDNWLIASVVPFLSTRGDNSFELSRWLLRMNRDMFQAKFAYDEDGDVILTVEVPTESLDPGEIQNALEGLLRYTVEHRGTLRRAAQAARNTT